MTSNAMPTATPRADRLLDEVIRLQLQLAADRRTADREWNRQAAEIDRLRAELADIHEHQTLPLSRLVLGVVACAVTVVVGVVDGARERRRRRRGGSS